jgi:hypothetical protein
MDGPPQYSLYAHQPYVTYEIHLHPTYAVPTLWFSLHDLPMGEDTFDLDAVYRYLVPDGYKSSLRAAGITGGISAAVSFGLPYKNSQGPLRTLTETISCSLIRSQMCRHSSFILVRPKKQWKTSTAHCKNIS